MSGEAFGPNISHVIRLSAKGGGGPAIPLGGGFYVGQAQFHTPFPLDWVTGWTAVAETYEWDPQYPWGYAYLRVPQWGGNLQYLTENGVWDLNTWSWPTTLTQVSASPMPTWAVDDSGQGTQPPFDPSTVWDAEWGYVNVPYDAPSSPVGFMVPTDIDPATTGLRFRAQMGGWNGDYHIPGSGGWDVRMDMFIDGTLYISCPTETPQRNIWLWTGGEVGSDEWFAYQPIYGRGPFPVGDIVWNGAKTFMSGWGGEDGSSVDYYFDLDFPAGDWGALHPGSVITFVCHGLPDMWGDRDPMMWSWAVDLQMNTP